MLIVYSLLEQLWNVLRRYDTVAVRFVTNFTSQCLSYTPTRGSDVDSCDGAAVDISKRIIVSMPDSH